jgi:hypothetical protein
MAVKKSTSVPVNNNINNNTNNVNLKVNITQPKERTEKKSVKKTNEPDWYKRTIIGGIIGLILSLCGYYIKKGMDEKSGINEGQVIQSTIQPIEGQKQN